MASLTADAHNFKMAALGTRSRTAVPDELVDCLAMIQDHAGHDAFQYKIGVPNFEKEEDDGRTLGIYYGNSHWYARIRGQPELVDGCGEGFMAYDTQGLCQTYAIMMYKAGNSADPIAISALSSLRVLEDGDKLDPIYGSNAKIALRFLKSIIRKYRASFARGKSIVDLDELINCIDRLVALSSEQLANLVSYEGN